MNTRKVFVLMALCVAAALVPATVRAHCDTMDGPVVKAAQRALNTGNVNLVLIWVQKKDETEVRNVFQKTLLVRKYGAEAREVADRYFFETVVRLHRTGEGASFTGLKPAGYQTEPIIATADKALEEGSGEELYSSLTKTMHEGFLDQFNRVIARKNFDRNDIEAGRAYVKTYVAFLHYIERLYESARRPAEGHFHESPVPE